MDILADNTHNIVKGKINFFLKTPFPFPLYNETKLQIPEVTVAAHWDPESLIANAWRAHELRLKP